MKCREKDRIYEVIFQQSNSHHQGRMPRYKRRPRLRTLPGRLQGWRQILRTRRLRTGPLLSRRHLLQRARAAVLPVRPVSGRVPRRRKDLSSVGLSTTTSTMFHGKGSSINDVTDLGEGGQWFCDGSTKALEIKSMTTRGWGVKNCMTSFMDEPYHVKSCLIHHVKIYIIAHVFCNRLSPY